MEAVQEVAVLDGKALGFPIADDQISKYYDDFMSLHIAGVDDRAGFNQVHDARMVIKNSRINVENRRKELVEESVAYQKKVNGEANRIKRLLEPIEQHLQEQEDAYKAEKERIRIEAERQKQIRLNNRMMRMLSLEMEHSPTSDHWFLGEEFITGEDVAGLPDDEFESVMLMFEGIYQEILDKRAEEKRKAEEEAARIEAERKAEADRIAAEQKAERERLAAERARQQEEQRKLDEERAKIQRMQDELAAEKKRAQDAENARIAAEQQRIRDERLKKEAVAEAKRKEEEKRLAEEKKAARKLALAPDKDKLKMLADAYGQVQFGLVFNSTEAAQLAENFQKDINSLIVGLREATHELI
ncbi:hypothetical protein GCM10027347_52370 [Larkinella harenae]